MTDFGFVLKEAHRTKIPGLFSLWGPQGCGKTLSALLMARGIVGPKGKIGMADTENGRGLFYADRDDVGPFFHLDLQPPFSPDKYTASFRFMEEKAMDIIVCDSASHVWEGEGGVLDMADKMSGQGLQKWRAPKIAHKRMSNNLFRSPIPVIFCIRAKDAVKQVGKEIVPVGWQPICEKNFPYEMTLDLRMTKDGQYDLAQSKTVPDGLRSAIPAGGTVTISMGQKIADWCGAGEPVDPETIRLKRDGKDAALQGVDAYTAWIAKLTVEQKAKVRQYHKEWSADAKLSDADPKPARTDDSDAAYLDDDPAKNGRDYQAAHQ